MHECGWRADASGGNDRFELERGPPGLLGAEEPADSDVGNVEGRLARRRSRHPREGRGPAAGENDTDPLLLRERSRGQA
jgi:hypothetical protein